MSTPKRKKNIEMQEDKRQINPLQKRKEEDLDIRKRPTRSKTSAIYENRIVSKRGFAAMDPERQREIASKGGRASHEQGHAHEFTSEEARRAGHLGGERTAESHEREFYEEIGHLGGEHTAETHGRGFYEEIGHLGAAARRENLTREDYKKTLARASKASHTTKEPEASVQRKRLNYQRQEDVYPESRQEEQRTRKPFEYRESAHPSRYRFEEHPEERSSQFEYVAPRKSSRHSEYENIQRESPSERQFEQEQYPSRSKHYNENRAPRHEYSESRFHHSRQMNREERELEEQRRARATYSRDEFEARPYVRRHPEDFEYRGTDTSMRGREFEENRFEDRRNYGTRINISEERSYRERNPEFRSYTSPVESQRELSRERETKSRRNPEYFENRYPSESEFQSRREFYPNYQEEEWNENKNFENELDSEDYELMEQEEEFRRKRLY